MAQFQVFNGSGSDVTALYDPPGASSLINLPVETGQVSPVVTAGSLEVHFDASSTDLLIPAGNPKVLLLYSESLPYATIVDDDAKAKQCYYIANDLAPYYVPSLASIAGYYAVANPGTGVIIDLSGAKKYVKSTPAATSEPSSFNWWIIVVIIAVIVAIIALVIASLWHRHK